MFLYKTKQWDIMIFTEIGSIDKTQTSFLKNFKISFLEFHLLTGAFRHRVNWKACMNNLLDYAIREYKYMHVYDYSVKIFYGGCV